MTIRGKIDRKIEKLKDHMVDMALEAGIIKWQTNYQNFIILGMGRTGSNMLASSLRSHTQIVAFGEIFNNADRIGWGHPNNVPHAALENALSLRERDPKEFLNALVFRRYPKKISAVGFKIFYFHAQEDNWKCIWPYLKSTSNLNVIHIKRRNMLNTLRSIKIAHRDGKWTGKANVGPRKPRPIELEYEWSLETLKTICDWETNYDDYFEDHKKINVIYEDLVKDYVEQMKHIQEFLGVKPEELRPSTKKQNTLTQSKAISNYWELKERFQGSPWAEFFEE